MIDLSLEHSAKPETFAQLVRSELIANSNDGLKAQAVLLPMLLGDRALLESMLEEILDKAINHEMRRAFMEQRRYLRGGKNAIDAQGKSALIASSGPASDTLSGYRALAADNLLNWPLRGGKRLGDATRTEVEAESQFAFASARTYLTTGKWFKAIVAQLPTPTAKVGENLSDAQLRTLRDQAEGKKIQAVA